jgi:AraC-like DNA-binding protein
MALISTPVVAVVAHDARREIGHAVSERETGSATRTLTQHNRARVWERIVVERERGDKWRDIAQRAQLSERQCRRIYRAHMRSAPTLERGELVRELEDAIADYDSAIEQLALISMTTKSDWARVVAIRARINARARKTELLSIAGVLSAARVEIDVRAIADAVMDAFDEHGVSDAARRAVLDALSVRRCRPRD